MRAVVIESPYRGDVDRNVAYGIDAVRDCISRGEAPFAGHLIYTLALDDSLPHERSQGINLHLHWMSRVDACVVYSDLGITEGMQMGIDRAAEMGIAVEHRIIDGWVGR